MIASLEGRGISKHAYYERLIDHLLNRITVFQEIVIVEQIAHNAINHVFVVTALHALSTSLVFTD